MTTTTLGADVPDAPAPELRFKRRLRPIPVLRELWTSRELTQALAERELRSRYKQTKMGFAWAIVTPLLLMVVFTFVFKRAARVDSGDIPYQLFAYVALVPWTFFSSAFSRGSTSLTGNMTLLNKVYCPREVFPLSCIIIAGVDMLIAGAILGLLFIIFTFMPQPESVWVPLLFAVQSAFTIGLCLITSSIVVYLRDVRQILPMLLQFALFATPIGYGIEAIPERLQPIYSLLNPLVPVMDGYRRTVLYGQPPNWGLLALGSITAVATLVGGFVLFKRLETGIADVA